MKRGISILLQGLRLYVIHISAILAIWLGMYFPGLDVALAILYLAVIWAEGKEISRSNSLARQVVLSIFWQLPALVLTILTIKSLSYYSIFMLELWLTPLLPFLSLMEWKSAGDAAVYLFGFYAAIIVIILVYLLPALLSNFSFTEQSRKV